MFFTFEKDVKEYMKCLDERGINTMIVGPPLLLYHFLLYKQYYYSKTFLKEQCVCMFI